MKSATEYRFSELPNSFHWCPSHARVSLHRRSSHYLHDCIEPRWSSQALSFPEGAERSGASLTRLVARFDLVPFFQLSLDGTHGMFLWCEEKFFFAFALSGYRRPMEDARKESIIGVPEKRMLDAPF